MKTFCVHIRIHMKQKLICLSISYILYFGFTFMLILFSFRENSIHTHELQKE